MLRKLLFILVLTFPFTLKAQEAPLMKFTDLQKLPVDEPTAKLQYGEEALQFGELRIPDKKGPHPVVVIIHGGCWLSSYDLSLMDAMATRLTAKGYATWNLEYRRVGDEEGGWPNTFLDVAKGLNYLKVIEKEYQLNLSRVVVTGHSAGGHLALWLAGKNGIPSALPIADPEPAPVGISGVVSLAGIVDLTTYLVRDGNSCGSSVDELAGGLPEDVPDHYKFGSPVNLLPHSIPTILITGTRDRIVPIAHVSPYLTAATTKKAPVRAVNVDGAGHFEVIAPGSIAWPAIEKAIKKLSRKNASKGK